MFNIEDRPLCILQRLHLEELGGGMRGLYELLAAAKWREAGEPAEKIRGASISKQDLCAVFSLFVEKLEKMRELDDKLRYRCENSAPPHYFDRPQPSKRRSRRGRGGKKHAPAP